MSVSPYTNWLSKVSETDVLIAALGSGGVVTVDVGGYVRLWETGLDMLQRSLMEWRNMIGSEDGRPLQVIYFACGEPPRVHRQEADFMKTLVNPEMKMKTVECCLMN